MSTWTLPTVKQGWETWQPPLYYALAALAWRGLGFSREGSWLGLLLLAVMPAHVFLTARVNNDAIAPLFGCLLTLLGWSYRLHGRWRTVVAMGVTCLLALVTKTSSVSLVAGAGLCGRTAPGALRLAWWFNRN